MRLIVLLTSTFSMTIKLTLEIMRQFNLNTIFQLFLSYLSHVAALIKRQRGMKGTSEGATDVRGRTATGRARALS